MHYVNIGVVKNIMNHGNVAPLSLKCDPLRVFEEPYALQEPLGLEKNPKVLEGPNPFQTVEYMGRIPCDDLSSLKTQ